jgi:hypothetical protein
MWNSARKYHGNVLSSEPNHVEIVKISNKLFVNQTSQFKCHELKRRVQNQQILGEIVQKKTCCSGLIRDSLSRNTVSISYVFHLAQCVAIKLVQIQNLPHSIGMFDCRQVYYPLMYTMYNCTYFSFITIIQKFFFMYSTLLILLFPSLYLFQGYVKCFFVHHFFPHICNVLRFFELRTVYCICFYATVLVCTVKGYANCTFLYNYMFCHL